MNVLKILFNPIFLLAAGLHAGLLLIPVAGGSSEEIVPAPDPEGESITVTHVPLKKTAKGAADKKASGAQAEKAGSKKNASKPNADTASRSRSGSSNSGGRSNSARQTTPRNVSREISSLGNGSGRGSTPKPSSERPSVNRDNNSSRAVRPIVIEPVSRLGLSQQERQDLLAKLIEEDEASSGLATLRTWIQGFWQRYYIYTEKGVTDEAVEEAEKRWLTMLGEQAGVILSTAPEPLEQALTIDYPLRIAGGDGPKLLSRCLDPVPKDGLIGVLVSSDGRVLPESSIVLRSSGYGVLDDIALNAVQDYDFFPVASDLQVHTVKVTLNYDDKACVSLANLGVKPLESETAEANEIPVPPSGGRNPLEEAEGEINPFAR
ncbi:MAG: hypothetical protein AAF959_05420 [Cyanobacteria bacterium P01_D01_bin.56]